MKPSCDPHLTSVTPRIRKEVRALSTAMLNARVRGAMGFGGFRPVELLLELIIRSQMTYELLDPHAPEAEPDQALRSDLSVEQYRSVLASDDGDEMNRRHYGAPVAQRSMQWYVECRKRMWPWAGCLPLGFPTRHEATLAMKGLERAGLCTEVALHQRIKVELDWDGVRRIMLGEPDA